MEARKKIESNLFETFVNKKKYLNLFEKKEIKINPIDKNKLFVIPELPKYSEILREIFEMIINNPIKAQFFKEFLFSEKSDENLSFYLAVKDFSSKKNFFYFYFFLKIFFFKK